MNKTCEISREFRALDIIVLHPPLTGDCDVVMAESRERGAGSLTATIKHYALPLPAQALPLELPEVQTYLPSGTGESPLANCTAWLEIWFDYETGASLPATQPRPTGDTW